MQDSLPRSRASSARRPLQAAARRCSDRDRPRGHGGLATKLARGSIAAFAVYVAGAAVTYCAQLALARAVGADGYGIYAYVLAWMSVLAYAAALGFNVSLMRFVPAYRAQEAWALLRGVIQYASRRAVAAGCAIALVGAIIVWKRAAELSPKLAATFLIGLALVPTLASLWVRGAVVRALGGVASALAPDRLVRDLVLLGLVGMASAGAWRGIDAPSAMGASVTGAIIGLGIVVFAMRRLMPPAVAGIVPAYESHIWRRTAVPLVIIGAADILMNRTGVLLLGWIVDTKEAGIYALVFNIALVTALPQTAVNALLAPAISDLFVRQEASALRSMTAKAALWTLVAAAGIALPIAVLAQPLLALFGHEFGAGVPALRLLLIGQVLVAGAGSQLYLLTMTGHERSAAVQLTLGVATNALIGTALIGRFGPTGAAIAATIAMVVLNVALALAVWGHFRFLPGVLAGLSWPAQRGTPTAPSRTGAAEPCVPARAGDEDCDRRPSPRIG